MLETGKLYYCPHSPYSLICRKEKNVSAWKDFTIPPEDLFLVLGASEKRVDILDYYLSNFIKVLYKGKVGWLLISNSLMYRIIEVE